MSSRTGLPLADNLLADVDRLLAENRHAESILVIACAFEVALAAAAGKVLLSAGKNTRSLPMEIDMLRKRYMSTIGAMSLATLRNLVISLITREVRPLTIADALDFIEHSRRYAAVTPAPEHIAAIHDPDARTTAEALRAASIVALSTEVTHGFHRATAAEVTEQRAAVERLSRSLASLFAL